METFWADDEPQMCSEDPQDVTLVSGDMAVRPYTVVHRDRRSQQLSAVRNLIRFLDVETFVDQVSLLQR